MYNVVKLILRKNNFYTVQDKDLDDFKSLANEVFWDVLKRYDEEKEFGGLLYISLQNKIMSEMTKRNRTKRTYDKNSNIS